MGDGFTVSESHGEGPQMTTGVHWLRCAGLVAVLALAACTPGRGSTGGPSTAPSLTAPSLDARAAAEQKALDAYRGMWRAYVDATRTADPTNEDLRRYATGDALNALVKGLQSIQSQGLRGKGDVVLRPTITSMTEDASPPQAEISDCVDTSGTSLYKPSGEPYQDTPGGKRAMEATVKDVGGRNWKVSGFALRGVGTC
jgi:hypothetical protein